MLERHFEGAAEALWVEHQFGAAELAYECTLYQMRSKALLLWLTNLRTTALLPNEFHSVRLIQQLPHDAYAPIAI